MTASGYQDRRVLRVGGMPRADLTAALDSSGVRMNQYARTLLDDAIFDDTAAETVELIEQAVEDLGLADGATLPTILATGQDRGLRLCPPVTGPYLRLAMPDQQTAPDSIMSTGRAPSGSLTVAAAPLREDDEYPKGFYLRVIDGIGWLRGYVCDGEHVWSPHDRFAFRL